MSGDPVFSWPDSSIFGRDATNYGTSGFPNYDTVTFPIPTVDYSRVNTHTVPSFTLSGDYAILVVGCVGRMSLGADPIIPICSASTSRTDAPMRIGSSGLGVETSLGIHRFTITAGEGIVRLFAIRRVVNVITAWLNGVQVGTFTDPNPVTFTVVVPAYFASGPQGFQGLGLAEMQVYDQPLSDSGFSTLQAALLATYPPG